MTNNTLNRLLHNEAFNHASYVLTLAARELRDQTIGSFDRKDAKRARWQAGRVLACVGTTDDACRSIMRKYENHLQDFADVTHRAAARRTGYSRLHSEYQQ